MVSLRNLETGLRVIVTKEPKTDRQVTVTRVLRS